mgnify:CR=1 FL=1
MKLISKQRPLIPVPVISDADKERELRQYMKHFYIAIILYIVILLICFACIFLGWITTLFSLLAIFMMLGILPLMNWHINKIATLTRGLTIERPEYY